MTSAVGGYGRPASVSPSFESEFDPCELIGTRIPFLDPFAYNDSDFQTEAPTPPGLSWGLTWLTGATPIFQDSEPDQAPVPHAPQSIVQIASIAVDTHPEVAPERARWTSDQAGFQFTAPGPSMPGCAIPLFQQPHQHIVQFAAIAVNTQPELQEVTPDRARLTPDEAIHICIMRRTKTARTAALLSAKYGISPKAIRDIWTGKTWAQHTRPYWSE